MRPTLLLLFLAAPAFAQNADVQKELMQRQQQSDRFNQQLRQSQERLAVPPGDLRRQQEIDARQFSERQRLDNVSEQQLRDVRPETPQALRPYERQKAEDERRALDRPLVPPVQPAPAAEPILPSSDRIILEPPRRN